jgi:uncharacterized membrane protein
VSAIDSLARPAVLGTLLAASVAVNMFLAGTFAGRIGAHAMHPPMFEREFESRLRLVPEERRREMRAHMRAAMPALREHRRKMHELREELAGELARETPDRATIEKQLGAIREQSTAMQEALHKGFLDTMLELTPAERRRTMDAMLEERGPGGPHHGPGPGGFRPRAGGPPPMEPTPPSPSAE